MTFKIEFFSLICILFALEINTNMVFINRKINTNIFEQNSRRNARINHVLLLIRIKIFHCRHKIPYRKTNLLKHRNKKFQKQF